MCEVALVFHTSFAEMEEWEPALLLTRRAAAVRLAKVVYG